MAPTSNPWTRMAGPFPRSAVKMTCSLRWPEYISGSGNVKSYRLDRQVRAFGAIDGGPLPGCSGLKQALYAGCDLAGENFAALGVEMHVCRHLDFLQTRKGESIQVVDFHML